MRDLRVYELTRDQRKLGFLSGAMVYMGCSAAYSGAWRLVVGCTVALVVCMAEWPADATRWRKVIEVLAPLGLMAGFVVPVRFVAMGMVLEAFLAVVIWSTCLLGGYWAGRRRGRRAGRL